MSRVSRNAVYYCLFNIFCARQHFYTTQCSGTQLPNLKEKYALDFNRTIEVIMDVMDVNEPQIVHVGQHNNNLNTFRDTYAI